LGVACIVTPGFSAAGQVLPSVPPNSQARGTLKGSVTDSVGRSLQAVEVTVVGTGRSIRTDSSGVFELNDIPVGSYRVVARRLGFRPQSRDATVTFALGRTLSFVLASAPQLLDAQKVVGEMNIMPPGTPQRMFDFYRRRRIGTGTYITRDQIDRAGSVRATLGGVSGIRVFTASGGQVRGLKFIRCSGTIRGGESPVAYFLDGLQTNDGVFSFLSDIDIEALEIYKGPASMPAEAAGNACAAVFIWTKR